ncbi:MAG: MscL family protein [Candidatus Rokubacteria bacterium]|nr:MscL family protein [Candidatus Rokubacteria bacterium]
MLKLAAEFRAFALKGIFLGEVVNFLLVPLAVFLCIVKVLDWIAGRRATEPAAAPPPTRQETLLAEIRDLLKARQV